MSSCNIVNESMLMQLRHLASRSLQASSLEAASFDHLLLRAFAAGPSNQMSLIKELRERTGAPVSEIKAALQAAEWDMGKPLVILS